MSLKSFMIGRWDEGMNLGSVCGVTYDDRGTEMMGAVTLGFVSGDRRGLTALGLSRWKGPLGRWNFLC